MEDAPFREVAGFFTSQPYDHLLVVNGAGQLRGAIALQDVKDELQDTELANLLTASDLVRPDIQTVTPEHQLAEALDRSVNTTASACPSLTILTIDRSSVPYPRTTCSWLPPKS